MRCSRSVVRNGAPDRTRDRLGTLSGASPRSSNTPADAVVRCYSICGGRELLAVVGVCAIGTLGDAQRPGASRGCSEAEICLTYVDSYSLSVPSGIDNLTVRQRELLGRWLPDAEVVGDHSWGLIGTTVLEVAYDGTRYIAKAGDENDHHLARELRAHRLWLDPWCSRGRAPQLLHADDEAKLLLRQYLPGELVQGGPGERALDTYLQAGALLMSLHGQLGVEDTEFETRENVKTLSWLDKPHRIGRDVVSRLRTEIASWPSSSVIVVPTHGDWQPRNWLLHDGVVSVIDFGRTELRPAVTDFARLAAQQFRADPQLEAAFFDGYGGDPRDPEAWRRIRIREAVGTTAWAYQVANEAFERQGHRMIAEALAN
jgi:hypothetical protein